MRGLTRHSESILWAARPLCSISCTKLCIASASNRCFSAFGMPSHGVMSPTDDSEDIILVDDTWNTKLALSFREVVHKSHHHTSEEYIRRGKTGITSPTSRRLASCLLITWPKLPFDTYGPRCFGHNSVRSCGKMSAGQNKPFRVWDLQSPTNQLRVWSLLHSFFYLVVNPSSPLLSLNLYPWDRWRS